MLELLCLLFVLWLCFKLGVGLFKVLMFLLGIGLLFAFVSSLVLPLLGLLAGGGIAWAAIQRF